MILYGKKRLKAVKYWQGLLKRQSEYRMHAVSQMEFFFKFKKKAKNIEI